MLAGGDVKIYIYIPPVLVPGLDLGVAELQGGSQLHPVLDTQVLLLLEAPLQPRQLLLAEGGPSFTRLLLTVGRPVGFVTSISVRIHLMEGFILKGWEWGKEETLRGYWRL